MAPGLRFSTADPFALSHKLSYSTPVSPYAMPRRVGDAVTGIPIQEPDEIRIRPTAIDYINDFAAPVVAGANLWTLPVGATQGPAIEALYIDQNDGNGFQLVHRVRDSGQATENGHFFIVGGLGFIYAQGITDPRTLGWRAVNVYDVERIWQQVDPSILPAGETDERTHVPQQRYISHPAFTDGFEYPIAPNRTLNYVSGGSSMRAYDIGNQRTLQGTLTQRDIQDFEGVSISEIWEGESLATSLEFFHALYQITNTPLGVGELVSWQPRDLSFHRHGIIPISLTVGNGQAFDINAIREHQRRHSNLDAWLDRTVTFTFRLARPVRAVSSLVTATGWGS